MKRIKQLSQTLLIAIILSSCKSINEEYPIRNSEENTNEKINLEKKSIEIKFSCGDDGISEYLDAGWNIIKEESQEKICTWISVPATKDCDMEKDKGCKIMKPDKIGQEKICTWKSVPATKDCDMEKEKGCKIAKPGIIGEEKQPVFFNRTTNIKS